VVASSPAGAPGLLERLKARTSAVRQPGRGPVYNHPPLWYARPDGDVVRLQGDPQNRAYYEDKGFAVLRPDEVAEWETVVRARVIAEQRRTANFITQIRRIVARNPMVEVLDDLNAASVAELEGILAELGGVSSGVAVIGRRAQAPVEDDPPDTGTEMGSGDALAEKIARSALRDERQKRGA
jgi:hypothetical protein